MNKKEAISIFEKGNLEDIIKTYSYTYKNLEQQRWGQGDEYLTPIYPRSQYLSKFKKSFIHFKMGKPITSKAGCLGEREFYALLSLCDAVKGNHDLTRELPSHIEKHIESLDAAEQLQLFRKMYGLKPMRKKDINAVNDTQKIIDVNFKNDDKSYPMVLNEVLDIQKAEVEYYGREVAVKRAQIRLHYKQIGKKDDLPYPKNLLLLITNDSSNHTL